ncbi:MAG: glycosyltransferase family 2 protein [Rhodobacteraceae bacterium]|nr:glycosyltransferase family 2 protein [Paracoccaceae bacterium]
MCTKAKTPSVAVVLPTYNRARHVCEAIDSILAQEARPEEVIVVDDGSTDDTLQVLSRYGDAIRVIAQDNAGASAARNAGAAAATADWLTFLDSDDLWRPERMTLLRRDLAAAPPEAVAHVANVMFRGVGDDRDFFSVARIAVPPGPVRRVDRPLGLFLHSFFLIGAAFRRDVFADLGGFDTGFPTDEDTELAHRMADRGPFLVRGDVVAEVIRRAGDDDALSALRGRDPILASDLKLRHFRGILARAQDPNDRALAARALSDALLQRAGLIRGQGGGGYWGALAASARSHPSPLKGWIKAVRAAVAGHRSRATVDRTGPA